MSAMFDTRARTVKLRDGEVMMANEAAKELGLSVESIAKLRREGNLEAVRTAGGWFIYLTKDVLALKARRAKAPIGNKRGCVARRKHPPKGRKSRAKNAALAA